MIVAVALVILVVVIPGPSEDGTVKLILNVSFPSTMLSLITVMFIVLLLVPAVIVIVSGAESKSMLLPTCQNSKHNFNKLIFYYLKAGVANIIPLNYITAQFKLDKTHVQHRLKTTCFLFHTHANMHVHTRLMMSNLPCITLVYALNVCMMHTCMSGLHMPNLDYACMQIISQGQRNKLYKLVHVLGCNPFMIQDVNPAK